MVNIEPKHLLDKFDGSNYQTWFIHMEMFFSVENNNEIMSTLLLLDLQIP
jgi:hypothetical protein